MRDHVKDMINAAAKVGDDGWRIVDPRSCEGITGGVGGDAYGERGLGVTRR